MPSHQVMPRWILAFAGAVSLFAADEQRLALAVKAQSEFNHVEMATSPDLKDTVLCIQSEAALLPVSLPEELPLVHYRKGYCTLAGALITHNVTEFQAAGAEFDKAIEGWPVRAQNPGKNKPSEKLPSALRLLSTFARLDAGTDEAGTDRAQAEIASAVDNEVCVPSVMSTAGCQRLTQTGRQWLGWIALRHDYLDNAAKFFSGSAGTGWSELVAGRIAFRDHHFKEAAIEYRQSIDLARQEATLSFADKLGPRHDITAETIDYGGAQLLAGDTTAAIATLDSVIKTNPTIARAFYLRARAKELAGQAEAAQADYNLASRTAFASAQDLASGEAHLYRGILYYRRKDFGHAEDEFSSALNFEIPASLRADAVAWRHLSAVANGSCAASREFLGRALATVTPYFPEAEARALMTACPATAMVGAPPK